MDFMNLNQAAHGDREFGYIQTRLGDNMRDVAVTEGDKVAAQITFGVSVNTYGVSDLASTVDAIDPAEVTKLVAQSGPRTSAESWLTADAPHYTALTTSLTREHVSDLADMLGVELLVIDADTNPRQFSNEIRWNQAYYRLAQGL
jgi:L-arabinose isomerase